MLIPPVYIPICTSFVGISFGVDTDMCLRSGSSPSGCIDKIIIRHCLRRCRIPARECIAGACGSVRLRDGGAYHHLSVCITACECIAVSDPSDGACADCPLRIVCEVSCGHGCIGGVVASRSVFSGVPSVECISVLGGVCWCYYRCFGFCSAIGVISVSEVSSVCFPREQR